MNCKVKACPLSEQGQIIWVSLQILLKDRFQIGIKLPKEIMRISNRILPINEKDLSHAIMLLEKYPKVNRRDAFHSATMINNDIREIISTDFDLDLIPEITRIDPKNF